MTSLQTISKPKNPTFEFLKVLPIIVMNFALLAKSETLPLSVFTTKFFVLYFFSTLCGLIALIVLIRNQSIPFTKLDGVVSLLFLYLLATNFSLPIEGTTGNKKLIIFCSSLSIYLYIRLFSGVITKIWVLNSVIGFTLINCIMVFLQKFGYQASNNPDFDVTGSFFHPAPLAGLLCVMVPICSLICYNAVAVQHPIASREIKICQIASFITLTLALLVLPSLHSRAATLSIVISLGGLFIFLLKAKFREHLKKYRVYYGISGVLLFLGLILFFFHIRRDSIDGRLLVWKVTGNLIIDKPIVGHGLDSFKLLYPSYQIEYFKKYHANEEQMLLSDEVTMAFNEILNLFSETGILGLILFMAILYVIMKFKWTLPHPSPETLIFNHGIRISILAFCIFSLFSYPFSILELTLLFFLLLAMYEPSKGEYANFRLWGIKSRLVHWAFCIISVSMIICVPTMLRQISGYNNWFKALHASVANQQNRYYTLAHEELSNNGPFISNYAAFCFNTKKYSQVQSLLTAKMGKTYNDYLLLADSYAYTRNLSSAKENYQKAYWLLPHRFVPLGRLLEIYTNLNDIKSAENIAIQILSKPIKIPSPQIKRITDSAKALLQKK